MTDEPNVLFEGDLDIGGMKVVIVNAPDTMPDVTACIQTP